MASKIPESVIQEVLDKADIESVVGKYVTFTKRTGSNLFGLCPFHSEKTASFAVSLNKGIYRCFGCNKGGNSIGFIMEIERLSFPEAVRFLGKEYGVEIPESSSEVDDKKELKNRIYALLTEAARFYYMSFNSDIGKAAREYAAKRKLEVSTLRSFGIGFSPDSWDALYKHLSSKGYTDDEMRGSGLFTVSSKTGKLLDLFRNRLMFPIFDAFGKIVAFGGRAMGDEKPKYINSPDSEVYKKQEHLFAFNFAKKARDKQLIIVEGYMDAIAMHQAGIKNAVAALGTAFTDSQLRLASKYAEEVVFFFDADKAGQAAALRSIEKILKFLKQYSGVKIRVKIACVPSGKDPDEYIKEFGADMFRNVVKSAKDVDDYLFDRAYNDSFDDNRLQLSTYQDLVIKYGSWISDPIKRYRFASNANLYLKATPEVLVEQMEEFSDKADGNEKAQNMRTIEKEHQEEIQRRSQNVKPSERTKGKGLADDFVTPLELEVFCYAMALKGNLGDSSLIKPTDIIRKGDFYGANMSSIVEFFLSHFVKGTGVRDDILIEELRKYNLNNEQAELIYLQASEKIPFDIGVNKLRNDYLVRLYKLRREMLLQKKVYLTNRLDKNYPGDDKEKLIESLKKIENGLNYIKDQEEKL